MRLWSIHPKYLDRQGLLAVWREGLLAQNTLIKGEYSKCPKCLGSGWWDTTGICEDNDKKCLKCKGTGKIKTPYYNHSQLERFKNGYYPRKQIGSYLFYVSVEAEKRGYNFDRKKIDRFFLADEQSHHGLTVTTGQLMYEFEHLQHKLYKRNNVKCQENYKKVCIGLPLLQNLDPHPLFKVIPGAIESWEKVK